VWAVSSTDPPEKLAAYSKALGVTFPLLSDSVQAATKAFGVLDPSHGSVLMAYPLTLVIDRKGVVRYSRVDVDFRYRPPASDLLDLVRSLRK
jgi:peroxiredoxin